MKTFKVYHHPTQGFEAVKVGFSWPALLAGFFWMMAKKMWGRAGLWFVMVVVVELIDRMTGPERGGTPLAEGLVFIANVALCLYPAFKGDQWRQVSLGERGFRFLSEVHAQTPDGAIAQVARLSPSSVIYNARS